MVLQKTPKTIKNEVTFMDEKSYGNKGKLVPFENRYLSIKADLIQRGLDLALSLSLHAKPLNILFCGDEYIGQMLVDNLKFIYQGSYDISSFISVGRESEILELAETEAIDIFILILNNIIFSSGNLPADNRMEKVLDFLTFMRNNYGKPIIGLLGWPKDSSFEQRAKYAGAYSVLRMPFKLESFNKVFESCLRPLNLIEQVKSGQPESS